MASFARLLLVLLFAATPLRVLAKDPLPLLHLTATASTESRFPYAVSVDVLVENKGKVASTAATVELTLTPEVSAGSKPRSDVPTMYDALIQTQELPALEVGESKVLNFTSHFQAARAFSRIRGSFKSSNIDPTGAPISVRISTRIK